MDLRSFAWVHPIASPTDEPILSTDRVFEQHRVNDPENPWVKDPENRQVYETPHPCRLHHAKIPRELITILNKTFAMTKCLLTIHAPFHCETENCGAKKDQESVSVGSTDRSRRSAKSVFASDGSLQSCKFLYTTVLSNICEH